MLPSKDCSWLEPQCQNPKEAHLALYAAVTTMPAIATQTSFKNGAKACRMATACPRLRDKTTFSFD